MIRRLFVTAVGCLGLSACGRADAPGADVDPASLVNGIEAAGREPDEDEAPPRQIAVLREADLGPEFRNRPSCRLHRDGRLLVVVVEGSAVARIDGRPVRLAISGPVGPTGAFLSGEGVTISVGREGQYSNAAESFSGDWPAGATIGGSSDKRIEKIEGRWTCVR